MVSCRYRIVLCLIAVCASQAPAQTALSLPVASNVAVFRIYPPPSLVTDAIPNMDVVSPVTGFAAPLIPDPDAYPVSTTTASVQQWRLITDARFDYTAAPGRNTGDTSITDIEFASTWNFTLGRGPLKVTPYFAVHLWNVGGANPFLYLYDLNVEFAWRPQLAEWLFVDLAVTPGLYTDFKNVEANSLQLRGRLVAIVAFSEKLQIAGGAMYVNRNHTKVLPAGGIIWTPSEDTRFFLVFPQPKISHRLCNMSDVPLWAYLAGEFGGGRWEIERVAGANDSLDYTDLRVFAGLEAGDAGRLRGHLEFGYVFNRRINYINSASDTTLPSTAMVRVGFRF